MVKMNGRRIVAGGLVAGLVINIGELVPEALAGAELALWLASVGAREPEGALLAVFVATGFVTGILLVWLYAALRPRYGAGPSTALLAALPVWFLACAAPTLGMAAFGLLPLRLILVWTLWPLVQIPVAALAGARLYREASLAPAASAPAHAA
jgi:hypothetical protein